MGRELSELWKDVIFFPPVEHKEGKPWETRRKTCDVDLTVPKWEHPIFVSASTSNQFHT